MTIQEQLAHNKEVENLRQPCQVMTRVCGWIVAKHQSNKGKQAEYADRVTYKLK